MPLVAILGGYHLHVHVDCMCIRKLCLVYEDATFKVPSMDLRELIHTKCFNTQSCGDGNNETKCD